jgi:molybdate transport system permease protein
VTPPVAPLAPPVTTSPPAGGEVSGVPRVLWAPAAVAWLLVAVPVVGLVVRVDWAHFLGLVTSPSALAALWLSLKTGVATMVCCLVFGGPLAVVLARSHIRGLPVIRSVVLLPLVLPPVVGGLTLLFLLGRTGLIGGYLYREFDITVPFSTAAVVLAQTFVAMPFLVVSLEGSLRTAGERYEAVAATLGASPLTTLWRVTIPVVLPGLLSGSVLAFARALGEFGATITFAGSLEGTTRTLPLLIYLQSEDDLDGAVAMSLVLVVVAIAVIIVGRTRDLR